MAVPTPIPIANQPCPMPCMVSKIYQDSARTKVWWFHGETETTREGITADLEAFRKAGVGGVVFYDQVHLKKPVALDAFSDEWWAMLYYAAREAERLGLTFETLSPTAS